MDEFYRSLYHWAAADKTKTSVTPHAHDDRWKREFAEEKAWLEAHEKEKTKVAVEPLSAAKQAEYLLYYAQRGQPLLGATHRPTVVGFDYASAVFDGTQARPRTSRDTVSRLPLPIRVLVFFHLRLMARHERGRGHEDAGALMLYQTAVVFNNSPLPLHARVAILQLLYAQRHLAPTLAVSGHNGDKTDGEMVTTVSSQLLKQSMDAPALVREETQRTLLETHLLALNHDRPTGEAAQFGAIEYPAFFAGFFSAAVNDRKSWGSDAQLSKFVRTHQDVAHAPFENAGEILARVRFWCRCLLLVAEVGGVRKDREHSAIVRRLDRAFFRPIDRALGRKGHDSSALRATVRALSAALHLHSLISYLQIKRCAFLFLWHLSLMFHSLPT